MENQFITYEQALELKEIGFNEPCLAYYDLNDKLNFKGKDYLMDNHCVQIITPLHRQVFKFFRENHNIDAEIYLVLFSKNDEYVEQIKDREYTFKINIKSIPIFIEKKHLYESYEKSEIACIKKTIELIKDKQSK